MTTIHGKNFLAGTLHVTQRTFSVVSPLDGNTLPVQFSLVGTAEVDRSLNAAADATGLFWPSWENRLSELMEAIVWEILFL